MKKNIISLLIVVGFCVFPSVTRAYDELYTHPYLTKVIINQWEKTSGFVLTDEEQMQIIAGSVAEDNPNARSLNHFYNPLNKQGLSINNMLVGYSTPEWLVNEKKQNEPIFNGSFTWAQGLEAYQAGDRAQALSILGHSLHLLEDMGMPAHTRNDEHLTGDAYESWVKSQNQISGQELLIDTKKLHQVTCVSSQDCLRQMAKFTNANFFSADTIYDTNFPAPKNELIIGFDGYARANGRIVAWLDKKTKTLTLTPQVLRDNWHALSPEIISYGVTMMNLFLTSEVKPFDSAQDRRDLPKIIKKITPQISSGGVKITNQDETLYLNKIVSESKSPEPKFPERWWPVIDLSQVIPRAFLGSAPSFTVVPQVAGVKITAEPEAIISTSTSPVLSKIEEDLSPPSPSSVPIRQLADEEDLPLIDPPTPPEPPVVIPDTEAPQASFIDLTSSYSDVSWTLNWLAHDNVSATSSLLYDVDFKLSSEWTSLVASTTATSTIFSAPLADGAKVDFRLRATDVAGNTSTWQEASTKYVEPNQHNPLIYEKLEHLYHFSECSGNTAHDTKSNSHITLISPWVSGPWDCGIEQNWPDIYQMSADFNPFEAEELTFAWYMKDVSGFNGTYSRNRLVLIDTHDNIALQIKPTVYFFKVISNGNPEITTAQGVSVNQDWHSVFVVVNKNYLAIYVDGLIIEQIDGDFSPARAIKQLILAGENGPTQFDEIAIWSRTLSSEEIMAYYNVNKPLKP
jgi:hypothetical protein